MRHYTSLAALLLVCILPSLAHAQAIPANVQISWANPIVNDDGSAVSGALALTKVQVWLSTTSIPADTTTAPTAEVTPAGTTTTQPITAPVGSRVYARVRACSAFKCSDLSPEGSGLVDVPKPGVPSITAISISITP